MAPTQRHRSNVNKSDNIHGISRKDLKRYKRDANQSKENKNHTGQNVKSNILFASMDTVSRALVSARLCSAIWSGITDCDETFNYWEPLHYLIYGQGLQTWEYSPEFAIRSYTYLMVHGVPGWIYQKLFEPSPLIIFYMIRCLLGVFCSAVEYYMYMSICTEFGLHIGLLWLIFQFFSAGMFIASTALLPSSFSMYFCAAAYTAWLHQRFNLAIFFVAISALLGWPFAVLVGIPIAYDILIRRKLFKTFALWALISAATISLPMIVIDSTLFGRFTAAPLNIILYNVFTDHGPDLYGTEPISYYLLNGFLNFNFIWILSLVTPILLILDYSFVPAKSRSTLNYPHFLTIAPFYLWLAVFFLQPHKEERFLYPIYPLISLCAAISVDVIQKLFFKLKNALVKMEKFPHYLNHSMFIAYAVIIVTSLMGVARVCALYRNYHAPMELVLDLKSFKDSTEYKNDNIYNVCIGKEWHRYPSSFFMPSTNFRIQFLKSEFKGILPAYYTDEENATAIVHSYFNDMNRENEHMYFDYQKCHFLLDLDTGRYTDLEPNYAARTKEWSVLTNRQFLLAEKSHRIFRSFYIPFVSEKYLTYGNFTLFKRKRMFSS